MKGVIRSVLLLVFVALPIFAHAQVTITEVMYDAPGADSGREWIEVYNGGTIPIPLTDWKLFENATNHKITTIQGGNTLAPDSYAVIADNAADFKSDWPQFTGQLFDSAFSLSNTGETIALRNASSSDVDSAAYTSSLGGAGDGNSLNRAPGDSNFVARSPSPGAPMSATAIPPPAPKVLAPKTSSKTSTKQAPASDSGTNVYASDAVPSNVSQESDSPSAVAQTAAAAVPASGSLAWWIAAGALALVAAGALVAAKHFGKKEWDIVEEKGE